MGNEGNLRGLRLAVAMALALCWAPAASAERARDLVLQGKPTWIAGLKPLNAKAGEVPFLSQGKVRMVVVWTSWCPYCKQLMLGLLQEYTDWRRRGLEVYVVSADDSEAAARDFLARNPSRLPVWFAGPGVRDALQVKSLPTVLLLDSGDLVLSSYGGYSAERFGYLRKRADGLLRAAGSD